MRTLSAEAPTGDPALDASVQYGAGLSALLEGDLHLARRALESTVVLAPYSFDAHVALGAVLQQLRLPSEALARYTSASELRPSDPAVHGYIGNMQLQLGRQSDALASYRRALELDPDNDAIHSNFLFALNSAPGIDRHAAFVAHRAWGRRVEQRFAAAPPMPEDRAPDRPLRVGYVSADFREHSVAHFIEPVWERIDRASFRTIVYDNNPGSPDKTSDRLRGHVDEWTRIADLSDDDVASRIRADRIDILVDLSGHTAGNRLPVFARRPAPVQVSWFAYMNTTGLSTMDYRLTDTWLAPPGDERFYTEALVRLPSAASWSPSPDSPSVNELPACATGRVTFGSFNSWTKVSDAVLGAWSRILSLVPGSRLLIITRGASDTQYREQIEGAFQAAGLELHRIEVRDTMPLADFLRVFHEVDVALDTFPYTGGTTTLHSLWMGVPVVSLDSAAETGRTAGGILVGAGIPELLAPDVAAYVRNAVSVASDLARLAVLRTELRERLRQSPVMSGGGVASALEHAFRRMWRDRVARLP